METSAVFLALRIRQEVTPNRHSRILEVSSSNGSHSDMEHHDPNTEATRQWKWIWNHDPETEATRQWKHLRNGSTSEMAQQWTVTLAMAPQREWLDSVQSPHLHTHTQYGLSTVHSLHTNETVFINHFICNVRFILNEMYETKCFNVMYWMLCTKLNTELKFGCNSIFNYLERIILTTGSMKECPFGWQTPVPTL